MDKLQCPGCGYNLKLIIGYSGCDWDTTKGEGSGFNYPVSLKCNKCGRVYTIGHVKKEKDFAEMKDELKVVE